ncbi:B12-binding domain-containing radical SAM protein [Thermodesulfobacteriota bacterium]
MKILLISTNTETINMQVFPLGLASVAQAVMNSGHQVKWLDLMGQADIDPLITGTINDFDPDVIGISIRNVDDQNMKKPVFFLPAVRHIVDLCKNISGSPIVAGGAGYSIFPDSCLEYINADMGIKGEGEAVFPELLKRLESNQPADINGLYVRGKGARAEAVYMYELDKFPLPDPDQFPLTAYKGDSFFVPVQTRRGCPVGCSYCSTPTIEGRHLRKRSPGKIISWLKKWIEKGFSSFQFVDNTFNLPNEYAIDLCKAIIGESLDIRWRSIIYPGHISDKLVNNMAQAGCTEISFGFESGSDDILVSMNKEYRADTVLKSIENFKQNNISVMGFLLLGGPGETRDTVMRSLEFAEKSGADSLKVTSGIRIYPGTQLAEIALKQGMVEKGDDLLYPRFYLEKNLEGWLDEVVEEYAERHPEWII